jgi:hypothetical protein
MKTIHTTFVSALALLFISCAPEARRVSLPYNPLFSSIATEDLRKSISSFVQVEHDVEYDIFEYPESGPPVGADGLPMRSADQRPSPSVEPVLLKKSETLTGAATILLRREDLTVLLTSAHLVVPRDTVDSFYYDEDGRLTNRLFRRAILRKSRLRLRTPDGWYHEVRVVAADRRRDVAILESRARVRLGTEFPYSVGYHLDLGWGDWVFAVGYPKGIKQLTAGMVSPSPYRGTLTLNAVVRFGYSGGPVLAFDPLAGHLALVGMIKSVPFTKVDVVVPGGKLAPGQPIPENEMGALRAESLQLIEYGSAYFVTASSLSEFFAENLRKLEARNIVLPSRFLP